MPDDTIRNIPYHQAIREALKEEMERDGRVFLLGEDIGRMGGTFWATRGLLAKFGPERVRDTPFANFVIARAANQSPTARRLLRRTKRSSIRL